MSATAHIMKMSRNGQLSVPADARHRWKTDRYLVVDLGDRVVIRPYPDDPLRTLRGKYRDRGVSSAATRRAARAADTAAERRRSSR